MKNPVFLRKATLDDAELLFSWANDMDVRRNAFQQHEITWDEHMAWLAGKLEDENCHIYIAYVKTADKLTDVSETDIGQVRLDSMDGVGEIDYSVSAQLRGKGYGTMMLKQLERIADYRIRKFTARVKRSNPASARVFEKCGFHVAPETEEGKEREKECGVDRAGAEMEAARAEDRAYIVYEKARQEDGEGLPAIVICTQKSWNIAGAQKLKEEYKGKYDITVITERERLTAEELEPIKPEYVFFPHWSYIIPETVFGRFTCVVFHMTDLPFGRGGSPLQNLIVRGFTHTKLSAIHVDKGLDTGDIYGKEELDLSGTADEILRRASDIIFTKMIPDMLERRPVPVPQSGEPVVFKRRKPEDGRLLPEMDERTIYDYIRMLDGEGYPGAFLELGGYRLRFSGAEYTDGTVTAKVTFEKEKAE